MNDDKRMDIKSLQLSWLNDFSKGNEVKSFGEFLIEETQKNISYNFSKLVYVKLGEKLLSNDCGINNDQELSYALTHRITRIEVQNNCFEFYLDYVDPHNPGNLILKCFATTTYETLTSSVKGITTYHFE